MDTRPSALGEDPWLGHARALRRLAAGLVRDHQEALDLVQDTWLRAGAEQRSWPWLSAVLRNLVRDRARERGRREWTERVAARAERLPSSAEIAAELELAQRVAREVAALEEPYRLVIHLRYFEDLGPEEIARRCGLPLETVRTRQKRALARLRERMDRAHGGERRAWVLALLPLARGAGFENAAPGAPLAASTLMLGVLMGTKLILSAAALVFVAFGFFLWRRGPEHGPITAPKSAPPAALARALERALPAADPGASQREPAIAVPAAPSVASSGEASRKIEGVVVIVDEHGQELPREAGVLTLASGASRADYRMLDVAFEEGRFQVEIRPNDWLAFGRLVARGREAVLPEPSPSVPGAEPLVVRGQWLKRGRIRVLDSVSRRELSAVEVKCAEGWRANPEWTHPGDDPHVRTVVADAVSPIDLPDRTWFTPYWVHAPGYAWTRVDFDHKVGGERTVELDPTTSSVTVTLDGGVPENAFVRLYAKLSEPPKPDANGVIWKRPPPEELPSWMASVSVRANPFGPTRIDDFEGGEFLVSIEVGEYEDRLRLGSEELSVPEGGNAAVTVRFDSALLDVPRTHLFGSIRVPPGLERETCMLRLKRREGGEKEFSQLLSAMTFHRGEEDVLRWDAGPMRTGAYLASFSDIQYRETLETRGPGQESEVSFVIPPLVSVRVDVVERDTGAVLEAEVRWRGARLPGVNEFTLSKVRRNSSTEALGFLAPHGEVEVRASLAGYQDASQELALSGASAVCRLELVRATGIRLSLREGEAALPVGYEYLHGIVVRDSLGAHVDPHLQVATHGRTIHLDEPGRYTLEFPPLEGFEPLEPRTLEVAAGELVELVVTAVRKP